MKMQKLSMGLIISSGILLSACHHDSDTSHTWSEPSKPEINQNMHEGRLVISNQDHTRPTLYNYDLNDKRIINTIQLNHLPSAIYSSPQSRYALIIHRDENQTTFVDGGIFKQGNKLEQLPPQLLKHTLYGEKPTHYRNFNGQAAIFNDGSSEIPASFSTFNDQNILTNSFSHQMLPKNHHGVAEPRGEYVLSTYTPLDWSEALPKFVKNFKLHGDHFHEEQNFSTACEGLHGAASNRHYALFGCLDGVLVVEQKGDQFIDQKIKIDQRIGTLLGHINVDEVLGFSSSQDIFIIDPKNQHVRTLDWKAVSQPQDQTVSVQWISYSFDATGQYFLLLDQLGYLHRFNTKTWQADAPIQVLKIPLEEIKHTQIIANQSLPLIYLNDTHNKRIISFDTVTNKIVQTIKLDDKPVKFTWVGIAAQ